MWAIVNNRYGSPDDLKLQEIDKPTVGDDAVLIRVAAASVNPYDWHVMRGVPYLIRLLRGLRGPKSSLFGADVAGHVETVGKNVTQVRPGDEVFGWGDGTFAEYVCVDESSCLHKPNRLTFEQAAAVPLAGCTALQALRDGGRLQQGNSVLINGASGGVGTFAVQIARALGAEVTGVSSTRNVDLVRSIGANHVVDYNVENFTLSGKRYDLILDLIANHSLSAFNRVLKPRGTLVLAGGGAGRWLGPLARPLKAVVLSRFYSQRCVAFLASLKKEDGVFLSELIEAGRVTPVIDRTYRLSEAPEAIRYLEAGHARGKVVITMAGQT